MLVWFAVINTKPNEEHSVYNALCKMEEVEYVYPLFGEWDIIVKITGESTEELEKIMTTKIRPLNGILAIKTLTGIH